MDTARNLPPLKREKSDGSTRAPTGQAPTAPAATGQATSPAAATVAPGLTTTWNDLDENGGVLEIHENGVHLTLSLFLVVPFAGARASSWWTTDDGAWLGTAHVGLA